MKIQISEDEVYEIKLPEEVNSLEKFNEILNKLERIIKLLRIKDNFLKENEKTIGKIETNIYPNRRYSKLNPNPFVNTREKVLDLLQYCYYGTKEDKERIEKIMGRSYAYISKKLFTYRKKYNIEPQEIGLKSFGTKKNPRPIRTPNYIIKSYTGIFDENGNENGTNN